MKNQLIKEQLSVFLKTQLVNAGYKFTSIISNEDDQEDSKYFAFKFELNGQKIHFRRANLTPDRPGSFLAFWQRPSVVNQDGTKPIPIKSNQIDYLFIKVQKIPNDSNKLTVNGKASGGLFIFPKSVLVDKNIITTDNKNGKTGFRVFPPWSADRGFKGMKVFSDSGKKTQKWQLPYFVKIDEKGLIDYVAFQKIFNHTL